MKKNLIKLISCFIPFKKYRKAFRNKYLEKMNTNPANKNGKLYIVNPYYGKIFMPYYPDLKFTDDKPDIYNKAGKKMDIFFIRDKIGAHCPYLDASKYFLWDRFNIGLDTHFYTHGTILEKMGKPTHRYAYFVESESIIPKEYEIFKTHAGIEKDFDAIFTYSEELLNTLDNAKFFPSCASVWYGKEFYNGIQDPTALDENLYKNKSKNISMICSAKCYTPMHKIRHKIANDSMQTGKVDMYGGFKDGKMFPYKSVTLKDYRYQIVVENDITPYYFTEKLLDCLVSQTIPIYIGATKISEFFNADGMIIINNNSDINKIIKQCTKEEYESRADAIKENYYKALKYINTNDLLYEMYFMEKKNEFCNNTKKIF